MIKYKAGTKNEGKAANVQRYINRLPESLMNYCWRPLKYKVIEAKHKEMRGGT